MKETIERIGDADLIEGLFHFRDKGTKEERYIIEKTIIKLLGLKLGISEEDNICKLLTAIDQLNEKVSKSEDTLNRLEKNKQCRYFFITTRKKGA